jgi:uncharacterized protein (TIRG00374 family)
MAEPSDEVEARASAAAAEAEVAGAIDPRLRRRRFVRLAVGIALSAVALWLAMRRTSFDEVGTALAGIRWGWLPVMASLKLLVLVIKDIRWRVELEAMAGPRTLVGVFRAISLGYFGNVLLPFRLGELMRVGVLKRRNPEIDAGGALATIAAERALDGAVLSLMVAAALPFAHGVPTSEVHGTVLLLVVMLAVVAVSMLTPLHDLALRILPARGPAGIARRIIDALSRGTAVLRRPRYLGLAALLTALSWLAETVAVWAAARALDLPLDFAAALVVTLLLSVALMIPAAPGQVGTHQALTALFVVPFGVSEAGAISLSIVLQVVALTTLAATGGYALLAEAALDRRARSVPKPEGP